jgi:hypothetical protein
MMTVRAEEDKKWQDAFVDLTEVTGITDTEEIRNVTIDYPLEIFDVSGNEIKIKEEFDEGDIIELLD